MRIGYFADGPWAHEAFHKIIEDESLQICFVMVRYDKQDPVLVELAKKNNIPVEMHPNINSQEFMDKVKTYDVDIFVSMSFNQIFRTVMPVNFRFIGEEIF